MSGEVRPDARLDAHVDALLARLVSESGFARGVLSRERLVSHLLSSVRSEGATGAADLAASALADRERYARIEALFSPPETWLFRYPESFDFLRARAAKPSELRSILPLRAFLAGCGGWCEPVSVAVALLDGAQATGRTVEVVATDRNAAILAQRPVFAGLAVRGGVPAWASARFHARSGGLEPDDSVVRVIRTRVADVVEAAESAGAAGETYDVVAFRNVAIYLDDAMRRRAFAALARIVASDGVLLVGHAEMVAAAEATGFVAADSSGSFALARATVVDRAPEDAHGGLRSRATEAPPRMRPSAMPRRENPREASRELPRELPREAARGIEGIDGVAARPSADPATFVAAALACEQAGDLAGAERAVGRALYLDRTHEEALVIAARLATARGAHDEAERFRARAMRTHLARENGVRREDSP